VSEAKPHPHKFDEFKGAPYRRRATLRYRLRSGSAFSMDHFLYGLPLDVFVVVTMVMLLVGKAFYNEQNLDSRMRVKIVLEMNDRTIAKYPTLKNQDWIL
jgi:hypothetical protein